MNNDQVFGPPPSRHATSKLPQHGFARTSRWEYLGKSSTESNNSTSDDGVKLDFGLSTAMLSAEAKNAWPYSFGLTYSVTLSKEGLETTMNVRNQGGESFEFQVLLHSYLHVQVGPFQFLRTLHRSNADEACLGNLQSYHLRP